MEDSIITINGNEYTFEEGDTILDVATRNGIYIPTLCHLKGAWPTGACRVCVVEVKGARFLVPACSMPVSKNMVVRTDTQKVRESRRFNIAFLMTSGNHNCAARGSSDEDWTDFQLDVRKYDGDTELCPAYGQCELQELAYRYQVFELIDELRLHGIKPTYDMELANPFILRDFSRCILCGRCIKACDEIQVNRAISFGYRGISAKIVTRGDHPYIESDCVFCGECLQSCPVGALVLKDKRYEARPWELKRVESTCTYCGTGCSIDLYVKDNQIVMVNGTKSGPVNNGSLCVRGRFGFDFVNSPDRLTTPLIREGDTLKPVSWDEALDHISTRLTAIKESSGPNSIAGLSSARCTNEDNYLMQKFMRAVIGTNNIDHCARLEDSAAGADTDTAYIPGAMTNPITDIDVTECMLLAGTDTTENHPVISSRMKRAVTQREAKLIVVDPRQIAMTRFADIHLQPKPGTDVAWINGIIHVIIEEDLYDKDSVATKTEAFDSLRETVKKYTPEHVEEITGIPKEKLVEAARLYAKAKPASIFYSMGLTQRANGADNVKSLANLALLCGNIGIPGGGVNHLRGLNNVQGANDMGCLPSAYPGYQRVDDAGISQKFSEAWKSELSKDAGLSVTEMMKGIDEGNIKALYIMGENLFISNPELTNSEKILPKLDFLVVQDIFMNEAAQHADVILPSAPFAEKEGTFTNTERRVQRVRKAVDSPGEAREDWKIISELARRMGYSMNINSASEIFDEMAQLTPSYGGMSFKRLDEERGLQWPCPTQEHSGTPLFHDDLLVDGKGLFHAIEYTPLEELPESTYPFILSTGQKLEQFQKDAAGSDKDTQEKYPDVFVEINPDDAEKHRISDGDKITVASRRGSIEVTARLTSNSPRGNVLVPLHLAVSAANRLTNEVLNPRAKIPGFKVCSVRLEK
jgi:formate dehydrogenase alpha subunit